MAQLLDSIGTNAMINELLMKNRGAKNASGGSKDVSNDGIPYVHYRRLNLLQYLLHFSTISSFGGGHIVEEFEVR